MRESKVELKDKAKSGNESGKDSDPKGSYADKMKQKLAERERVTRKRK